MLKGLAITPPVVGRISIGRVVEKNGKRLPERDDQFHIDHPSPDSRRLAAAPPGRSPAPAARGQDHPSLRCRSHHRVHVRQTPQARHRLGCCQGHSDDASVERHGSNGLQRSCAEWRYVLHRLLVFRQGPPDAGVTVEINEKLAATVQCVAKKPIRNGMENINLAPAE